MVQVIGQLMEVLTVLSLLGALALMLDPGSVIPPSTSYLSAGGVLYLSFDEVRRALVVYRSFQFRYRSVTELLVSY